MKAATLDAEILAAHGAGDGGALVQLYQDAAALTADETARAFYLVHAYVYALETSHADKTCIQDQLRRMGREV